MARAAFLGLHELERNKSFHCQHQRTTRNVVARKFACSLSLPLSRALLLFQLGFGGFPTSFPPFPSDSSHTPSLSPSTISFSSCQGCCFIGQRGHYCITRVFLSAGRRRLSTRLIPWPGGSKPKTAQPQTSVAGPRLKTGCSFRLCRFLICYQDTGWHKAISIFDTTTGTYFCVSVVHSSMCYLLYNPFNPGVVRQVKVLVSDTWRCWALTNDSESWQSSAACRIRLSIFTLTVWTSKSL